MPRRSSLPVWWCGCTSAFFVMKAGVAQGMTCVSEVTREHAGLRFW
jgi:hypothetical protein